MAVQATIRKVVLTNFLSHKQTEVSFDRGVTVIVGENGAGKSSILEAIYFALTGTGFRGGKGERTYLINVSASEASVKLWLDVGGQELYIERTISRRGRSSAILRYGRERVVGDKAVTSAVRKYLGLGPEALASVVILRQGSITEFFGSLKPGSRKELIDKLLELDAYNVAREELKDYCIKVKGRVLPPLAVYPKETSLRSARDALASALGSLKEVEGEIARLNDRLKQLEGEAARLERELREVEERRKSLESRVQELRAKEREYSALRSLREKIVKDLEDLRGRLGRLREEVESLRARVAAAERVAEKAKLAPKVEELKSLIVRRESIERELRSVRKDLELLTKAEEELKELRAKYPEGIEEAYRRLQSVREELEKANAELRGMLAEAGKIRGSLEEAAGDALRREGRVRNMLRGIAEELGVRPPAEDLSNTLEELRKALARAEEVLRGEKRGLEEELSGLRRAEGELRARISAAEEKLKVMESGSPGSDRCPLCGSPLTREKLAELRKRLEAEAAQARRELEGVGARVRELEGRLARLELRLQKLAELKDRLETAAEEIGGLNRLREKTARLKEVLMKLEEDVGKLHSRIEELKAREEGMKGVERDYGKYENLLITVRRYTAADPRRREAELLEALEELKSRIGELEDTLSKFYDLSMGIEYVGREAEEALRVWNAAQKARGELEAKERELGRLEESVGRLEGELAGVEERLKSIEPLIEELRRTEAEVDKLVRLETDLRERLAGVRAEAKSVRERLAELEERAEALREDVGRYREAIFKAAVLLWIRDKVYHPDGAPKLLRQAALRSIEDLMKKYLELFNTSYTDVRIDDNLNVSLSPQSMPGTWIAFSRLSGGEKVAVSLSALLALHQVVSGGRVAFLMLDEPTEHLDEERRRQLIEILKEFRGGGIITQLVVVTHDEDVREAADTVYEVVKDRYSAVREVNVLEVMG